MAAVAKCDTEIAELDQAIQETTANLNSLRASLESAADGQPVAQRHPLTPPLLSHHP